MWERVYGVSTAFFIVSSHQFTVTAWTAFSVPNRRLRACIRLVPPGHERFLFTVFCRPWPMHAGIVVLKHIGSDFCTPKSFHCCSPISCHSEIVPAF